ncbi:type II secretion system protein GspL [Pusillimonas sp. MFBS29]|uniref:type II secretion system protein GspL n=1 Tax=Pusillimonas sp. MFBS29 TaxID=2886690 RepID=UPI001D0FF7F7|nr:type II secretion system protein GspL [Pusillimonas sp. MFBS29]MCC2595588.1 type II secretion system protein GspL [Pusillimonas sp. MFBS29]
MKSRLRLALPPLTLVAPDAVVAFALLDRNGQILRSGQLPLDQIAQAMPADHVQAILHPGDAIVIDTVLPPLPAKRLAEAVQSSVEPMALTDVADLCIAHGPRAADGSVCIAWTDRSALLKAWSQLEALGLRIKALVPFSLAVPANDPHPDQTLQLPANQRWQTPLPGWSLAQAEWRPVSTDKRWRSSVLWLAAAAVLWLAGLQIYASQLRNEVDTLTASTEAAVRAAFPSITVILDPVKQARNQLDMLRQAGGEASDDEFMPLALGAAQVLGFAEGHVAALEYEQGNLTLVLTEGYTPPSNEAALHQAAAAQSLLLAKDDQAAHTWHIRHAIVPSSGKEQP